jgi:hypothetical protein
LGQRKELSLWKVKQVGRPGGNGQDYSQPRANANAAHSLYPTAVSTCDMPGPWKPKELKVEGETEVTTVAVAGVRACLRISMVLISKNLLYILTV